MNKKAKNVTGKDWLYIIGGIAIIATAYEINRRAGIGLFIVAVMAIIYQLFVKETVSFTSPPERL